jgi:16S rRNA (cytosine1402-N4)-methyltransferase
MHAPVLVREVVDLLQVKRGGVYVDATLGSGGHARALLEQIGAGGRLFGVDRDAAAVARARAALAPWASQCVLVQGNFAELAALAGAAGFSRVDGVLMDCGVSSEQLEAAERGFSFSKDGPLDMRMDPSRGCTAADLLAGLDERELCALLRSLGEEPAARRIARAVVRERARAPLVTTGRLAQIVAAAAKGRRGRIHPATRTFLALRLRVNDELESLAAGLRAGVELLAEGGRMAVISFQSQEDRIVKRFFAGHAGRWVSLPAGGRRWEGEEPALRLVNRKAVRPLRAEVLANPRARSAVLRVAERRERQDPTRGAA